jgi:hypothetical protein
MGFNSGFKGLNIEYIEYKENCGNYQLLIPSLSFAENYKLVKTLHCGPGCCQYLLLFKRNKEAIRIFQFPNTWRVKIVEPDVSCSRKCAVRWFCQ